MEPSRSYENLSDNDLQSLYDSFMSDKLQHGYYKSNGYMFTAMYKDIEQDINDLEVFDDDIWICSYPKSGTTWLSETVWSICNDLNTPNAKLPLESRIRFLEYSSLYRFDDESMSYVDNSVKMVQEMQRPRFIKTHLPWSFLPRQIREFQRRPRVIHIARNPKDVAVSYFHHNKMFRGYSGSADLFYEMFLRGLIRWCPYMGNVHSYWTQRHEPNVLFLKFEEMRSDLSAVIRKIAEFLPIENIDSRMSELLEHLSFQNMKKNDDLSVDKIVQYINEKYLHESEEIAQDRSFFRKGVSGAHKKEMSDEMKLRFDQWMETNLICGLKL